MNPIDHQELKTKLYKYPRKLEKILGEERKDIRERYSLFRFLLGVIVHGEKNTVTFSRHIK